MIEQRQLAVTYVGKTPMVNVPASREAARGARDQTTYQARASLSMRHKRQGPALATQDPEEIDLAGGSISSTHSKAEPKQQRGLSVHNGLAAEQRWVAWREEDIKRKDGTEAPTKIPYDPRNGRKARTDDPSTVGQPQGCGAAMARA